MSWFEPIVLPKYLDPAGRSIALTEQERQRLILGAAMASDDPVVQDNLTSLLVLTAMAEHEEITRRMGFAVASLQWINAFPHWQVQSLVNRTLESGNTEALAALENFVEVARGQGI